MKIEHLAVWVEDLEQTRDFYTKYFDATSGPYYRNMKKNFESYFLYFGTSQTRLELMQMPGIAPHKGQRGFHQGIAHFAISVGSKEKVHDLTDRIRNDGYIVFSEPRTTGDGYYESVVLDPEGNYLEISA